MNPNEYLARVFISAEKAFEIALNPYFEKVDLYYEKYDQNRTAFSSLK